MERASGILMPVFSLPSPHGIGTLGKEAYAFADFLHAAGQKYWQVLPLGPTGFGDSPYQSESAFAGNPYFIDLDELVEQGLLQAEEISSAFFGGNEERVDYAAMYCSRWELLRKAFQRSCGKEQNEINAFRKENPWLEDYALFFAAKRHFAMKSWTEWDEADIRLYKKAALRKKETVWKEDMEFCIFVQYQFFRQWNRLREYVHSLGIQLIGDVPIYVPLDSADVWANRDSFQLDKTGQPTAVAGCPPDAFTEDGQLWGNPLYNWKKMKKSGFAWWIQRLQAAAGLYDVVRIDHFRGLESYWSVPFGEETARNGSWCPGPDKSFIDAVRKNLPQLKIIAEDLGFLTPEVEALREYSGYPGMKILQFAFSTEEESEYLPHRHIRNCVCYTGTHDNATLRQWLEEAGEEERTLCRNYLHLHDGESWCRELLRAGMRSVSNLFISPVQDWLELGEEGRINVPGVTGNGNWTWRLKKNALTPALAEDIRMITKLYGR